MNELAIRTCKATHPSPCNAPALPGSEYCALHNKKLYNLDESDYLKSFTDKVNSAVANPRSRSLHDEIGILRVSLERVLSQCTSDTDLVLRSSEIQALTSRIESLVKTSFTIDKEIGELLSRDEAKALGAKILQVLIDKLKSYNEKITKATALIPLDVRPEVIAILRPDNLIEEISDALYSLL